LENIILFFWRAFVALGELLNGIRSNDVSELLLVELAPAEIVNIYRFGSRAGNVISLPSDWIGQDSIRECDLLKFDFCFVLKIFWDLVCRRGVSTRIF
jgi:hypothetical protein